jgi:LAO/AO transport system kinase
VEIAGLADTTMVVLVPEAGDEVQTMKAGLMEIADVFVVNKADRPDADTFVKNLRNILRPSHNCYQVPVVKTIASQRHGIEELIEKMLAAGEHPTNINRRIWLLTEKAYHLIMAKKMAGIDKAGIFETIQNGIAGSKAFNLYRFVNDFLHEKS